MKALSHLDILEAEAIYILRESRASFERIAILFSGGKDSITLAHLAAKAFYPQPIPFALLHIDTGHNFPETIHFRDNFVKENKLKLIIGSVAETIRSGKAQEEAGPFPSRNAIQSITLLETISKHNLQACIGGGRRDEEKARAKERFFSLRNAFGEWDPKTQRPELWNLYNTHIQPQENIRIFPISNWTELDVWEYILKNNIAIPDLYFAHHREVIKVNHSYIPVSPFIDPTYQFTSETKQIRFRTIGDMTCTAAIPSQAKTVKAITQELRTTQYTERGSRLDDKRSTSAMEERKKQGYF
ncbi:sulfate adenylyltransferase subunit 2 [Spirochaetota bacterium]|nr:sulfate adenylyltransferase subunit 2 [Spirochaetota bacterium]